MFAQDTGLYFYSAWLQADAAIFALVFIFFIYKLQSIENTITNIMSVIHSGESEPMNSEALNIIKGKDAPSDYIDENRVQKWKDILESLGEPRDAKNKIYRLFKPILVILPIILLLISILLLFSSVLHCQGALVEGCVFGLFLFIQLILIVKMVNIIRDMLIN